MMRRRAILCARGRQMTTKHGRRRQKWARTGGCKAHPSPVTREKGEWEESARRPLATAPFAVPNAASGCDREIQRPDIGVPTLAVERRPSCGSKLCPYLKDAELRDGSDRRSNHGVRTRDSAMGSRALACCELNLSIVLVFNNKCHLAIRTAEIECKKRPRHMSATHVRNCWRFICG